MKASLTAFALLTMLIPSSVIRAQDVARLYQEAQQAQAAGDLAAAARKYEAIIRLRPEMAEAYANLGNLYYQQGQPDRAVRVYQKAIEIKADLAGPHFFLGVIEFGRHRYASALRHLERAESLQASNALIHAYLGYTHYARSAYREAARELETAAASDPNDIDVLYHLSKSYGHLAKDAFGRLRKQFPGSVYLNISLAHIYETEEKWNAAGEQYRLALEKMPRNARLEEKVRWIAARSANAAASADDRKRDGMVDGSLAYRDLPPSGPKLAEELQRQQASVHALERDAPNDQRLYLIAEGYQALSFLASLRVMEAGPDSYRAHQLRAQLLESSNQDREAIEEYRKALERKPDLQNIHFAIGSLHWKEQRFDEARAELQRELAINPSHPQALYELGDIAAFTGDAQRAEKYFLAALSIDPNLPEAHLALEKIYTQSGRYEKSLEHLRRAREIDSSDPGLHYRFAAVYRKMGRNQDADRELAIFKQKSAARSAQ